MRSWSFHSHVRYPMLRIRIRRIRTYVFGPPGSGSVSQRYGSGSFYHQAKIVRKTLISTFLLLLYDFLSLKKDVNVSVFWIRIRRILMFLGLPDQHPDPSVGGSDPHPDPYQNVTDPQRSTQDTVSWYGYVVTGTSSNSTKIVGYTIYFSCPLCITFLKT
jgi:hypothetical protein